MMKGQRLVLNVIRSGPDLSGDFPRSHAAEKEIKIGVLYPLSGLQRPSVGPAESGRVHRGPGQQQAPRDRHTHDEVGRNPKLGGAKIKLVFARHRGEPTVARTLPNA